MFRRTFALSIIAFSTLFAGAAMAKDPVYTARFSSLAVDGYDAEAKPVKGDKAFSTKFNGAEWRCSSAENLAIFTADPEAYAPQYGGYCAWAVAQNYTARGNPANWAIVDGKLYLNYNNEIQERWNKDIPGFIASADKNWPAVLKSGRSAETN